jgi:predicted CXXCH cytochrome family protein
LIGVFALAFWWQLGHRKSADHADVSPAIELAPPPVDPRLTFATPYRNVRPDVQYVGDEVCASCHPNEAESFRKEPMGRSAAYVAPLVDREGFDRATKKSFEALGLEFQVGLRDAIPVHKEIRRDAQHKELFETQADILLAIGSGAHGRSFATNRDGYLFQSPVSWFSDSHTWNLSPGFEEHALHFQRPISVQCLFCHVNQAFPMADAANRYVQPFPLQLTIGCERCHGPGQLHVHRQNTAEGDTDVKDTIVNPAKLEPNLREAICQQCHLLGEERIKRRSRSPFDFRPGLPLYSILSVFVRPPDLVESRKTVSHVEQMYQSLCFRDSQAAGLENPRRALGCISCHDPHRSPAPEKRVAFFRERCLRCHEPLVADKSLAGLSHRHSKTDNCIECHMPRRSAANIAHDVITDHRILRRADEKTAAAREPHSAGPGQIPLVDFYRDVRAANDPDLNRDLALAMIGKTFTQSNEQVRKLICERALPHLKTAVRRDPEDIDAQEDMAYALWILGNPQSALTLFEAVLSKVPERQYSLENAGRIAAEVGEADKAIGYLKQLVAANRWNPSTHYLLAKLLGQRQDWAGAVTEARASLELDPSPVPPRLLLVAGYLQTGDKKHAREEFNLLERLQPPEIAKLREWFQTQSR